MSRFFKSVDFSPLVPPWLKIRFFLFVEWLDKVTANFYYSNARFCHSVLTNIDHFTFLHLPKSSTINIPFEIIDQAPSQFLKQLSEAYIYIVFSALLLSVWLSWWQVCTWQYRAGHTQHSWGVSESLTTRTLTVTGGRRKVSLLLSHTHSHRWKGEIQRTHSNVAFAHILRNESVSGLAVRKDEKWETPVTRTEVLKYDITEPDSQLG